MATIRGSIISSIKKNIYNIVFQINLFYHNLFILLTFSRNHAIFIKQTISMWNQ